MVSKKLTGSMGINDAARITLADGIPPKSILKKPKVSSNVPGKDGHMRTDAADGSKHIGAVVGDEAMTAPDRVKGSNDEGSIGGVTMENSQTESKLKTQRVNFRSLVNEERVVNHDIVLPQSAIDSISNRYANSLVGCFIGKSIAFPVVQNYVTNTWGQFGLQNIMRDDDGVFLFKFASKAGLERVLERGPWMICNSPIILSKWSPYVSMTPKEVTKVSVWIKLRKIPFVAYSEDVLSLIATQVGKPIMLDAFTSSMCCESWGRISYARALVEISAGSDLKTEVSMAIPTEDGKDYTRVVISVEYEWKPPHCTDCKIFGHSHDTCLKKVRTLVPCASSPKADHYEGFTEVKRKKNKGRMPVQKPISRNYGGGGSKPTPSSSRSTPGDVPAHGKHMPISNSFDVLYSLGEKENCGVSKPTCAKEMNHGSGKHNNSKETQSFGGTQQNDYVSAQPDDQNTNNVENDSGDDDDGIGVWGEDKQVINEKHRNPSYNPSVDGHRKNKKTIEDGGFTTGTCTDGRSSQVAMDLARIWQKVAELKGNLNGVGSVNMCIK